ncbi:MAG: VCBS repeat-containing protein [Planctomycetota bacterium]|nr:VCBS repeat-containing protein [Planctomycetota bacterium]
MNVFGNAILRQYASDRWGVSVALAICVLLHAVAGTREARGQQKWVDNRFEEFSKGSLDASGHNLYISRDGALRTINQFDLNTDGHLDLIFNCTHDTYQMLPATVGWLAGAAKPAEQALGVEGSRQVALGDLNRDGYTDAVFCPNQIGVHHDRRHVSIAWGGPDGWSARRINGALPMHGAVDVAIADLNGDPFPDIAVLGAERWRVDQPVGNIVRIFWGSADGFALLERLDLAVVGGSDLAAADLDGNGTRELAVLSTQGHVTLMKAVTHPSETNPPGKLVIALPGKGVTCLAAADLEGRGQAGLVVGTVRQELYQVGFGAGLADAEVRTVLAGRASQISVGDLDKDGSPDLVLTQFSGARAAGGEQAGADSNTSDRIRVLWGQRGAFSHQRATAIPLRYVSATAIGDLNGDNHLDLAVAIHQSDATFNGTSCFYLGNGRRGFQRVVGGVSTAGTSSVAVAPREDTRPARAVFCNSIAGRADEGVPLLVYWGNRDGFRADDVWEIPFHSGYEASAADLNADGFVDLIALNSGHAGDAAHADPTLGANIFWGSANGFDLEGRRTVLHEHFLGTSGVADLNRDGYLDLVLEPFAAEPGSLDMLFVYYGSADGFHREQRVAFPSDGYSQEHLIADLNGDGWLDIAVTTRKFHCVRIFWNGPDGFDPQREHRLKIPGPVGVDAADFNSDGHLDLLVGSYDDPLAGYRDMGNVIFWGSADGYQSWNAQWLPGFSPLGRSIADLDGDGHLDIFSPQHSGELTREDLACHIYWGSDAGFATRRRTTLYCDSVNDSMIGDFNSDGKLDLAVNAHTRHGNHRTESRVFYNDGRRFQDPRIQKLPTNGPHLMWAADVGHIADRSYRQRYESNVFQLQSAAQTGSLRWQATIPPQGSLVWHVRSAPTRETLRRSEWRRVQPATATGRFKLGEMDRFLQYRVALCADNGCSYPIVRRVEIEVRP